jgi:dienelactone hydrolase
MMSASALREVRIDPFGLFGFLDAPNEALGLVLFAHGSGSGRHSPRNNYVAHALNRCGIATLLLDLLTPEEEQDRRKVFDIGLLAARLDAAADWARGRAEFAAAPIGHFGASTGAGAALRAAAGRDDIAAVVSRGGRPDLAMEFLAQVEAPTLLIVGSLDGPVIGLNEQAHRRLARSEIAVVDGAGHLFEEPGALDAVIRLAGSFFLTHFHRPHARAAAAMKEAHDRRSGDLR